MQTKALSCIECGKVFHVPPAFYHERARKPRSFEGGDEWPYLIWSLGWVLPLDEQPDVGQA